MSYRNYQKMMGLAKPLPEGVTTKDFDYKGNGNDWYGTIYLKDGVPREMSFYDWDSTTENWKRGCAEQLAEFEGDLEVCDVRGAGNGHYHACIRPKEV